MILRIHPKDPQTRLIRQAVKVLEKGGVIIFPTDTVYGLGCDVEQRRAIERVYQLKQADRKKPMSIICPDLSVLSDYVAWISTPTFRVLKRLTPGPYTFILEASSKVPRMMLTRQRTIGIRIPDNPIAQSLVRMLERPLMTTSIKLEDETAPIGDPDVIYEQWGKQVALVIDGGIAVAEYSTIVDFTPGYPVIVRKGKGDISSMV